MPYSCYKDLSIVDCQLCFMTNTNKKYERTQQGNLHRQMGSPIPVAGVSNSMAALLQIPAVTAMGSPPRCAQAGGVGGVGQAPRCTSGGGGEWSRHLRHSAGQCSGKHLIALLCLRPVHTTSVFDVILFLPRLLRFVCIQHQTSSFCL